MAYPKFRLSPAEQDELLADYLPDAETVRIPQPPPTVPDCRDVLDLPFMHLAVDGKAQVLVSGDRDLLAIATEFELASSDAIMAVDIFCQTCCADPLMNTTTHTLVQKRWNYCRVTTACAMATLWSSS